MNETIPDEDYKVIKCQIHKGMPLLVIHLDEQKETQRVLCSKCIRKHNVNCKDLLFIDDILSCDENTIFENWPIQNQNNSILQELLFIFEDEEGQDKTISPSLVIQFFFDEFQKKITEKINSCMKNVLSDWENVFITKEKLLEIYNGLSQKQKLKESVQLLQNQNLYSFQMIQNLVNQMSQQQKSNQQILKQSIDQYRNSKEKLKLDLPKYFMEEILKQITYIETYLLQNNRSVNEFNEIIDNNDFNFVPNYQNISQSIIKMVSNKFNFCSDKFIVDIQNFLNQAGSGLNKIQIETIFQENKQPIDFSILGEKELTNLEDQIRCLCKINNELLNSNGAIDFQKVKFHKDELSRYLNNLQQQNENNIYEFQINHTGEINKTFTCNFVKSKQDEYSITNQLIRRDTLNRIKIKQIKPGWQVQSYLDEIIDPSKKYLLRIQFDPFPTNQQNYRIYIGILEDRDHASKWLDSSPFLFSNNSISGFCFNKVKKGLNINHNQIRYDKRMRYLEFQMCLMDQHFLIADYPEYQNITVAESEKFQQLHLDKSYRLVIESESVSKIRIQHFSQVKEFQQI